MTDAAVEPGHLDEDTEANHEMPSSRRPRWRLQLDDWGLFAAIVLVCVGWWFALQRVWFFADDFVYIGQAKGATMSVDFLRVSNYGHFAPVTRGAYWIMTNWFNASHRAAALMSLLPLLVAATVAAMIVREISSRPRWLPWLVLLPMGTAFMHRVVLWWGASIHILVALAFSHIALYCWLRSLRSGSWAWWSGAVVSLALGLLTQERPMLTIGAFFLLRFITPPGNEPWPSWKPQGIREVLRWLPIVGIALAATWNQLKFYPNDIPGPSPSVFIDYMRIALLDYFLPGIVGQRGGSIDGWSLFVRWGALLIIGALVVDTLRRRRYPWRAPIFFTAMWLVHVAAPGAVKAGIRGAEGVASDPQYYVDAHFIAIFALALAFSQPLRTADAPSTGHRLRVSAAVLSVFLIIASAPAMFRQMDRESPGPIASAKYSERVLSQLATTDSEGRRYLPSRLPAQIAPPFIAPFSELQEFRRVFQNDTSMIKEAGGRLMMPDDFGGLREIAPEVIEQDSILDASRDGRVSVSGPATEVDGRVCFSGTATSSVIQIRLKAPLAKPRWNWNSGPAYDIPVYAALSFTNAVPGAGGAGSIVTDQLDMISHPMEYATESGVAIARLDQDGPARSIVFSGLVGSPACIGRYVLFHPVALPVTRDGTCDRLGLGGEREAGYPCPKERWDPFDIIRRTPERN